MLADDSQWKANVESVFEFNSQELSGDMNVDGKFSYPNLNSGIKLKAQVKVQSFADHTPVSYTHLTLPTICSV